MPNETLEEILTNPESARTYLSDEDAWPADALLKMSDDLLATTGALIFQGAESIEQNITLKLNSPIDLLNEGITTLSSHWPQYVSELKETAEVQADNLARRLAEQDKEIVARLVLTSSIATKLAKTELISLLLEEQTNISFADDDPPGTPELEFARNTINAPAANEQLGIPTLGLTGEGQTIAVLDGEVPEDHIAFAGKLGHRVTRRGNFGLGNWNDNGMIQGAMRSHGTAVAGIIAGDGKTLSGQSKYVGIAPLANIHLYRIYPLRDRGAYVVQAIEEALFDGHRVASLSWGQKKMKLDATSTVSETVDRAFQMGMLVIKSAGNDGWNTRSRNRQSRSISAPADAHNVCSVGMTSVDGLKIARESSFGPTIDGRNKPEIVAPGDNVKVANPQGALGNVSGTSYAAPMVAGVAALLLQAKPSATCAELRQALIAGANPIGNVDTEIQGAGLIDIERSLNEMNVNI